MKNKKYISLALSTVLAIGTITPAFAVTNNNVKKEETVYVLMNDKGKIKEETVSVWLHSDDKINIKDKTNLKDIKNLKGDEKPEKDGNELLWKSDKNDIYYQGKSTKALPVDIKVTYKLNGKEMSLKKMEGKSGKLEIIVEAVNKEKFTKNINGKNETLYTPYIVAGGLSLSTDKFKNVESNGKILDDGKTQAVGFSLFPGMAETFRDKLDTVDIDIYDYIEDKITVTADVKDFERPTMLFTVADLFQTDTEFKDFDSFDELTDALEELDDKGQEMLDGAIELKDGSVEFSDAIYDLVDAHKELYDGSNELYDGANNLQASMEDALDGTKLLSSGSQDLNDGAKKLNKGLYDLISGINTLNDKMEDLTDGAKKLKDGTDELVNGTGTLNDGAKAFKAAYDEYSTQIPEYVKQAQEAESSVSQLNEGSKNIGKELESLRDKISSKMYADTEANAAKAVESNPQNAAIAREIRNLEAIRDRLIKSKNNANTTNGNINKISAHAEEISPSDFARNEVNTLTRGIGEMIQHLPEEQKMKAANLQKQAANLNVDTSQITAEAKAVGKEEAIKSNNETIAGLDKEIKLLNNTINSLKAALNYDMSDIRQDVDKIIADNTKQTVALGIILEQLQNTNKKIAEGYTKLPTLNEKIIELTDGIDKLYEGSKDLQEGTGELYDGTLKLQEGVSQLKDGADKIYDGSTELQEGTEAAVNGTKDLDEGLNKLQLEGISPLKDGVGKLSGGLSTLYGKSPDLTEAADDLVDGTTELADGVNRYMDEGIKKMRSEVTEKTDDVEDIMAIRDELVKISQNNDSFTGKPDGVQTKVKYVIKYE